MEQAVYQEVKRAIHKLMDISLDHYKDEQMRRRLDSWLVRSGARDWNDYLARARADAKELEKFRNYLTINVSAFFRDPERWRSLREQILPGLLQNQTLNPTGRPPGSGLRIWSAGCSIGPEPYTLAMILDEAPPAMRERCRRSTILATDLDRGALAKGRARGPYTAEEMQNLTPAQRAAYLDPGGPPYFVRQGLQRQIEFAEHNMLSSPFPEDFDLIVCRNVVIYFTGDAKDALYRRFQAALRPGGILFVGATEIIPRPNEVGLVSAGISFYQKPLNPAENAASDLGRKRYHGF